MQGDFLLAHLPHLYFGFVHVRVSGSRTPLKHGVVVDEHTTQ